jgi:putative membrane protein
MEPIDTAIPVLLKALHLFALVAYFAGTFHIVRLFVAHREAMAKWEPDRTILTGQFTALERSALYYLIWPALLAFVLIGAYILWQQPGLLKLPFMQVLLGYMAVLMLYHGMVHRLHLRLRSGEVKWGALQLRAWAQGATLFLFLLIVLVLFRERTTWVWGALGLLAIGGAFMLVVTAVRGKTVPKSDA